MDDWLTVRQASYALEVSIARVYALIAAGTLSSKKLGLTTLVNKRSVALYKESPSRNKYAGGHLKPPGGKDQLRLDLDGEEPKAYDGGIYTGVNPPLLSEEARRLYDESPRGQREARLRTQGRRGEV